MSSKLYGCKFEFSKGHSLEDLINGFFRFIQNDLPRPYLNLRAESLDALLSFYYGQPVKCGTLKLKTSYFSFKPKGVLSLFYPHTKDEWTKILIDDLCEWHKKLKEFFFNEVVPVISGLKPMVVYSKKVNIAVNDQGKTYGILPIMLTNYGGLLSVDLSDFEDSVIEQFKERILMSLSGLKSEYFKKCQNCGNWFFYPQKRKRLYCSLDCTLDAQAKKRYSPEGLEKWRRYIKDYRARKKQKNKDKK